MNKSTVALLRYTAIISLVCSGVLVILHLLSSPWVEHQARQRLIENIRSVMPGSSFEEQLSLPQLRQKVIRIADRRKKFIGYAIMTNGSGTTGPITLLTGLSGNKITGVSVISHSEAQGIDVLIRRTDPMMGRDFSFLGQFRDKHILDSFKPGEDIVALPQAPLVSKGICEGVRRAVSIYRKLERIIE